MSPETTKPRRSLHRGKKGYYTLEFTELEGGEVRVEAVGPIPFDGPGWVSVVATETAKDDYEAERRVVTKLVLLGS